MFYNIITQFLQYIRCPNETKTVHIMSNPQLRYFQIKIIRPDGVVHLDTVIKSENKPRVQATHGGVTYINSGDYYAPVGWKIDIEECPESQDVKGKIMSDENVVDCAKPLEDEPLDAKENAKLIAAASCLKEALTKIRDILDRQHYCEKHNLGLYDIANEALNKVV